MLKYPLVNIQKAIENGDLVRGFTQLKNAGSFHSFFVNLPEGTGWGPPVVSWFINHSNF